MPAHAVDLMRLKEARCSDRSIVLAPVCNQNFSFVSFFAHLWCWLEFNSVSDCKPWMFEPNDALHGARFWRGRGVPNEWWCVGVKLTVIASYSGVLGGIFDLLFVCSFCSRIPR